MRNCHGYRSRDRNSLKEKELCGSQLLAPRRKLASVPAACLLRACVLPRRVPSCLLDSTCSHPKGVGANLAYFTIHHRNSQCSFPVRSSSSSTTTTTTTACIDPFIGLAFRSHHVKPYSETQHTSSELVCQHFDTFQPVFCRIGFFFFVDPSIHDSRPTCLFQEGVCLSLGRVRQRS